MEILQWILALGLLIGFFAEIYLFNKLKDSNPDKKDGKLSIVATANDDFFAMNQQISNIRVKSDCIQDDGKFSEYPSDYILECDYRFGCIKEISLVITAYRNIYPKEDYGLILQTNKPLGFKTTSDKNIKYRIIVLKKYKKEDKPMDEKQKILNDIEEAQRKLDEARKKLDEYNTGYKRFKPKNNEVYYYVISNGTVGRDYQNDIFITDIKRYDFYNCFKTREQAEAEAENVLVRRMLEDIARRLNKGQKIDWGDENQYKWYIVYNTTFGFEIYSASVNTIQGVVYCLDKNFLNIAIQEIGEERLKKYLRGEA